MAKMWDAIFGEKADDDSDEDDDDDELEEVRIDAPCGTLLSSYCTYMIWPRGTLLLKVYRYRNVAERLPRGAEAQPLYGLHMWCFWRVKYCFYSRQN